MNSPSSSEASRRDSWQWIVLCFVVSGWYYSNGMNGVIFQSFAKQFGGDLNLGSVLYVASFTTFWQLMAGALTAVVALLLLSFVDSADGRYYYIKQLMKPAKLTLAMSVLHGVGSIFTNTGFMYGKASTIQAIKLLEPLMTLMWTMILLPGTVGTIRQATVASVMLVVTGSISLVCNDSGKKSSTIMMGHAIFFACASGMTMTSRNVLQRWFLSKDQKLNPHEKLESEGSASKNKIPSTTTKIQGSIVSFGSLSLWGAFVSIFPAVFLQQSFVQSGKTFGAMDDLELYFWHPMYNLLSIVTLGFCSALTHSLLNSGKRIVAIGMAIIWFHESLSSERLMGLGVSFIGGVCYVQVQKNQSLFESQKGRRWELGLVFFSMATCAVLLLSATIKSFGAGGQAVFMNAPNELLQDCTTPGASFHDVFVKALGTSDTPCEIVPRNNRISICHLSSNSQDFGGSLGPASVQALLGSFYGGGHCQSDVSVTNISQYRPPESVCLFNSGSVLHHVKSGDHVWGTRVDPLFQDKMVGKAKKNVIVHAFGGALTEQHLVERGLVKKNKESRHAEPGYLIPFLYPEYLKLAQEPRTETTFCFMGPVYDTDWAASQIPLSIHIIPAHEDWVPIVSEIATQCSYVASSSLDGIIIADALGIPFLWFQSTDSEAKGVERNFKFLDYLQSVGRMDIDAPTNDASDLTNAQMYSEVFPLDRRQEIAKSFACSFPFHLFKRKMIAG